MEKHRKKKLLWSLLFIIFGVMILLHNWGLIVYSFKFSRDWPVILIAIGLLQLWKVFRDRDKGTLPKYHEKNKKNILKVLEDVESGKINANEAVEEMEKFSRENS